MTQKSLQEFTYIHFSNPIFLSILGPSNYRKSTLVITSVPVTSFLFKLTSLYLYPTPVIIPKEKTFLSFLSTSLTNRR